MHRQELADLIQRMYPNSLVPTIAGPILTAITSIQDIAMTGERIGDDLTNVLEVDCRQIIAQLRETLQPIKVALEPGRRALCLTSILIGRS